MRELDPYHRWLGIPPKDQPPNHYRLLAIELFENDAEVIRDAAERQMGHVRRYGLGKHAALSQKVLNALGVAKACLLNPAQKLTYDAELRIKLTAQAVHPPLPPPCRPAPPPLAFQPETPPPASLSGRTRAWLIGGIGCGGLLLCLMGALALRGRPTSVPPSPLSRLKLDVPATLSVQVGRPLSVRARVNDAAIWKNRVEFRFSGREPEGATIHPGTGEIRWTPKTPGRFALNIGVLSVEGPVQHDVAIFNVTVRPDAPKLIAVNDQSIDEGQELRFNVAVSNSTQAGSPLLYRLGPNAPRGACLDPHSGQFTWTPQRDPGPGRYSLSVDVISPAELCDQVRFRVEVRAKNHRPTLRGPDSVRAPAGTLQHVQLEASDPDGPAERLTYSLVSAPPWVTLDARSGRLSCAPSETEAETSHTVCIRVTDDSPTPLWHDKLLNVLVEKNGASMASLPAADASIESTQVQVMLSGERAVDLTKWDLTHEARDRAAQLRARLLSRDPGVFGRWLSGPESPIVDLCGFQRGREIKLSGDLIVLHEGIGAHEKAVDWSTVLLKRYARMVNGRWQGPLCVWDLQNRRVYYGEYDKGKRHGYCCLFQDELPRLILECSAGKLREAYLLTNNRLEKRFLDESSARRDGDVGVLLYTVNTIEIELREYDETLRDVIQKEYKLLQSQGLRPVAEANPGRDN